MSINTVDIEGNEAPQKGTPVLQDAYLDVRFTPKLRFRAGKIKTPLGIQRLQSAQNLLFAERALTNNLVANRDVGLQVQGELDQGAVAYQLAVLNGVPDGATASRRCGAWASEWPPPGARPSGPCVPTAPSRRSASSATRAPSPPTATVPAGRRRATSTSARWAPKDSFVPSSGKWGAVQLVARLNRLDRFADATRSVRQASAWAVGVNWIWNRPAHREERPDPSSTFLLVSRQRLP